jgi:hypothetical protein
MKRLLLLLLVVGCAHEQPEADETSIAAGQPATFAEGTIPPIRKKCRKGGPRLTENDRASGRIVLDYLITEDGKVKDVSVKGDVNASAAKAIRAFLSTCAYQPATQNGRPVPVKWKGELVYPVTTAPAPR